MDSEFLNKEAMQYKQMDVKVVTYFSSEYPELLKQIATPPICLYCRGDVSLLKSNCLAVVGSRRSSRYGKNVTEKFVKDLASSGFTIVSGLADGIDAAAHHAALAVGEKTIAVLAGGVNEIYPYSNIALSNEIAKKGLLISENKPNRKAVAYQFPIRNRIIAGLSLAVLIPEARLKSGSMHTKEYALETGRDLFVVPGNIDSKYSEGCNAIIKSLQGCAVTCVEDILDSYNLTKKEIKKPEKTYQLSIDEQIIYNIVSKKESSYEEILVESGLNAKMLNTLLTTLQLRGIIKKLPGNIFSK
jgi:DNA processing protein